MIPNKPQGTMYKRRGFKLLHILIQKRISSKGNHRVKIRYDYTKVFTPEGNLYCKMGNRDSSNYRKRKHYSV